MNSVSSLVSVIIPVYNGADYLAEAIESVFAQSYMPMEIIVVDDGSTDQSAQIVQTLATRAPMPVRYVYQTNQGPGSARNHGISLAQGDLLAFLDQDDVWLPDKTRHQVAWLEQNPDLGYVLTMNRLFLDANFARPEWVRPERLVAEQKGFFPSCLLARRQTFDRIGLFDPSLFTSSDTDWMFRANDANIPMVMVPLVLLYHRIHPGNQSRLISMMHTELVAIARRSIKRKQVIN